MERTLVEVLVPDESDEDGDAVGDVETDGGNGRRRRKGHRRAQGWKAEDERKNCSQPDRTHWALEPLVDIVEEMRDTAIATWISSATALRNDPE